jgi:hypothetical protein
MIKRWVVFYFSLTLFFLLLPIILSYSLGYKIDYKELKIYKTGIIYLKSQPAGASVYLNGAILSFETPGRIEELRPGEYYVEVRKEGFYPWQKILVVRPNMVTKAEEIVLFPLSQEISRVIDRDMTDFAVSDNNVIYYMSASGLFSMNMDGTNIRRLSSYSEWPDKIKGKAFSPDGNKLLFFDNKHIWVIYLKQEKPGDGADTARVEEVVKSSRPIVAAFWYSQSNYIVFVADKNINVVELSGQGVRNTVTLYKFISEPKDLYYDINADSLYFTDTAERPGYKAGNYLRRIDLRQKFFDNLMDRLKKELDIRYEKK